MMVADYYGLLTEVLNYRVEGECNDHEIVAGGVGVGEHGVLLSASVLAVAASAGC